MTHQHLEVRDKFTGEVIGSVPLADRDAVDRAVTAAKDAFPAWSHTPAHRRSDVLFRAADMLEARRDEIATTIAREAGKAWKYAVAEAERGVETFRFSAEEAKRIHGETVPMDASAAGEGRWGFWVRVPVGVVAAITPFNFPLNLVAHKVGPALAAGNSVVLKPASTTPLTAALLCDVLRQCGLPPGVLELVVGPGSTVGDWLVTDRRVAKVSFTGSPSVGESIVRAAGLKKVTMELGNNSGTIVEPDADLTAAIPRCVMSAFANSGQVCISLQRLYVHASIFEDFTRRFVAATAALKVGNPMERDCDVGPMISQSEVARVVAWIAEAEQDGARVLAGGRSDGSMLQPTVLCDVAASMNVMCQEVFAPVVCLVSYDDFDAALAALDDSEYGLQAGVWTNDLRKAFRAIERLDCGGVMVNDTSIFWVDHMPYGGNRRSGLGREGVRFAVEEMTNIKMVVIRA